MRIGIHDSKGSYSDQWIKYCEENNIDYKIVNVYNSDIVEQLHGCDAFMWHHNHGDYRDKNFAKQLLFSLAESGIKVFPDFETGWHFDDKLGQKYLFEALGIQAAKGYAFYDKESAKQWAHTTTYPKVFKLRGGAGSSNVKLANSEQEALKLIDKAFGVGFSQFDRCQYLKDRYNAFQNKHDSFMGVCKAMARIFILTKFAKMYPREKGYVYFQEFIPNDGFDFRLEIVGDKMIALVRMCRKNDFRASGGHMNQFNHEYITPDVIKFGFETNNKLNMQSCALDIVRDKRNNQLFVIEACYCYGLDTDEFDHGYWDKNGVLHQEKFNGLDLMIESFIRNINE